MPPKPNKFYRISLLSALLCLLLQPAFAQILDDSTQNVYGPETTRLFSEQEILWGEQRVNLPDTSIRFFHRFSPVEQSGYRLQDLGNLGTALGPVLYTAPGQLGARTGVTVYEPWFRSPEKIRYYDTKSPYTRLLFNLAGNGRSRLDVSHSRNINTQWNAGFDFRRLTSDKQLDPTRSRDDKQVVSTAYDFYVWHRSKNERYTLMTNFSRLRHRVNESGGILVLDAPEQISDIIAYENSPVRLQGAESEELRVNYHLYQEYRINKLTQIYYRGDRQHRIHYYTDNLTSNRRGVTDQDYYYNFLISNDSTNNRIRQNLWQHELGLKGKLNRLGYGLYYKRRDGNFKNRYGLYQDYSEDYAGAWAFYQVDSTRSLEGKALYLVDGAYRLNAAFNLPWLRVEGLAMEYLPTYIQQEYFGNHDEWHNEFENSQLLQLKGELKLSTERFNFRPGLTLNQVNKHVYFKADSLGGTKRPFNVRPLQADSSFLQLSPSLAFDWEFARNFHLNTDLTYTRVTGEASGVINTPEWLVNSSLFYEGEMFGGSLFGQLGFDVHWRSAFYANAYDPVTQQFVLQNDFEVDGYPIVDFFFGFRINRTRVFLRMSHLNEGAPARGYFITPYYSGTQRTFDIGIDWLFFD